MKLKVINKSKIRIKTPPLEEDNITYLSERIDDLEIQIDDKNELIDWDNLYDLASLTKILSSVPLLMNEFENKTIDEESTLSDIIPDLNLVDKRNLLLKEMLAHQSGLYPWIPFYKETLDSINHDPLSSFYSKKKTINILFL